MNTLTLEAEEGSIYFHLETIGELILTRGNPVPLPAALALKCILIAGERVRVVSPKPHLIKGCSVFWAHDTAKGPVLGPDRVEDISINGNEGWILLSSGRWIRYQNILAMDIAGYFEKLRDGVARAIANKDLDRFTDLCREFHEVWG